LLPAQEAKKEIPVQSHPMAKGGQGAANSQSRERKRSGRAAPPNRPTKNMSTIRLKRAFHRSFALRHAAPAVIVCCLTALVRPALPDTITDLGTLGFPFSQANGINASGQVVGYSETPGGAIHAFLYSGGVMTDLGTLGGGGGSIAYGIDAGGEIVGSSTVNGNPNWHAFSYSGGVMTDLGPSSESANAVDSSGQIVGFSSDPHSHAFLYSGGLMTDLGTLGGYYSTANGINASGQIVGAAYTTGNLADHAFLYSGGIMTDLGTLGGNWSNALGINASGQIVGEAFTTGNSAEHAFLYSGGIMTDLGTLGGDYSEAWGIDDGGQAVGESYTKGDAADHAFLYSGGIMTDLNSLLPAGSGWKLTRAAAINDSGQIVGYGTIEGQTHAFLLDTASTPEPGSLALLGAGLVAAGLRRWSRPGKLPASASRSTRKS
jgi:probable HAF family extracellular repeat protein